MLHGNYIHSTSTTEWAKIYITCVFMGFAVTGSVFFYKLMMYTNFILYLGEWL